MTRKRWLFTLLILLSALIVVLPLSLWLAAPQLLAWQLRAQLEPLGCALRNFEGLQRGWQHWQLDRLDLQCQSASMRVDIHAEHVQLALQLTEQRITGVDIGTLQIDAQFQPDDSPAQWPQFPWPQLPLDQLHVQTLALRVQHPALALDWQGRAQIDLREREHFRFLLSDQTHTLSAELRPPAKLQTRLQRGAELLATLNLDATLAGAHNTLRGNLSVHPELVRDARLQDWIGEQIKSRLNAQPALQTWHSETLDTALDLLQLDFTAEFATDIARPQQLASTVQISGLNIDADNWQAGLDLSLQLTDTDADQQLQINVLQLLLKTRDGRQSLQAGLRADPQADQQAGQQKAADTTARATTAVTTNSGAPFTPFRIQRSGVEAQTTLRSDGELQLRAHDAQYGDVQLQLQAYAQQGDLLTPQSRNAELRVIAQGAGRVDIAGSALHKPAVQGMLHLRNQGHDWLLSTPGALRFTSGKIVYPASGKATDRWTLSAMDGTTPDATTPDATALDAALLAEIDVREQAGEWQLQQLNLSADSGALQIRHGSSGTLGSSALHMSARGSLPQLDWQLNVRELSLLGRTHEAHSATLKLDGHARLATAPVALSAINLADAQVDGRLHTAPLRIKGFEQWPQPQFDAQFRLHKRQLVAEGNLRAADRTLLPFRARHHLASGRGQADMQLDVAAREWWSALTPRPRAVQALNFSAGQLAGTLHAQWQPDKPLQFQMQSTLQNGALQLEAARASALSWQAELRSGGDANAASPLQLQAQLDLAEVVFAAGFSARKLHGDLQLDGDVLQIGNSTLDVFDGQLRVPASTLDLRATEQLVHLGVMQLDLAQILALVAVDGLSGEGRLDGVLPVVHDAAGIGVRDGVLQSTQPGLLRYNPAQLPMADNIGLQALRNFHYDELVADVQYQPDGSYLIGLKLKGRNPDLYNGFPISFRLNLNGQLPGLFRAALLSGDFNQHVLDQLREADLQAPAVPAAPEQPGR